MLPMLSASAMRARARAWSSCSSTLSRVLPPYARHVVTTARAPPLHSLLSVTSVSRMRMSTTAAPTTSASSTATTTTTTSAPDNNNNDADATPAHMDSPEWISRVYATTAESEHAVARAQRLAELRARFERDEFEREQRRIAERVEAKGPSRHVRRHKRTQKRLQSRAARRRVRQEAFEQQAVDDRQGFRAFVRQDSFSDAADA